MTRLRLDLEYVGTRYRGWQIQKNARTVQGELSRAIEEVAGRRRFELYGSGRTDAGVHALGQVAHLEADLRLPPSTFLLKVNDALPPDINLLDVRRAHPRFHARHSAIARTYLYQIARRRTAFAKPFVWWIKDALDVPRMARAARSFEGMHDFQSFTEEDPEESSTRVLVEAVEVQETADLVLLRIRGSHFLWKMVRRMVGVLAEVGRCALAEGEVERLLAERSAVPAPLTAPPSGLFLERVRYEGEPPDGPLAPVMAIGLRS